MRYDVNTSLGAKGLKMSYRQKEGVHLIDTRVVFLVMLNWIPKMGERISTAVSWPRRGSSDRLSWILQLNSVLRKNNMNLRNLNSFMILKVLAVCS